jgi:ubiquinone/menaquinone biosynthesis C-methylase UbiE
VSKARYDGHAGWYDETFSASRDEEEEAFLTECLGAGRGEICLDVACGTGRYGPVLTGAGYRTVGFDISGRTALGHRHRYREELGEELGQEPPWLWHAQDCQGAAGAPLGVVPQSP